MSLHKELRTLQELSGIGDQIKLRSALNLSLTENGSHNFEKAVRLLNISYEDDRSMAHNSKKVSTDDEDINDQQSISKPQKNSVEDEELRKAIELSLIDNHDDSLANKDKNSVVKSQKEKEKRVERRKYISNNEMIRTGQHPVGLRNMGNSCWFSAVIQSFFHLPLFRTLILEFKAKKKSRSSSEIDLTNETALFVYDLGKLFALMMLSKRKFIDPYHVIGLPKSVYPDNNSIESQQDVNEFSLKLIEFLEKAFSSQKTSANPITHLFYGNFKSETFNQRQQIVDTKEETFGQYPLQVNNFIDINDSLEASMFQEIDYDSNSIPRLIQYTWFSHLPPILLFELSRLEFDQNLSQTMKLHNKFEFPKVIFMDRYLFYNKAKLYSKKRQVRKLTQQLEAYEAKLKNYLNCESNSGAMALSDILNIAINYVYKKSDHSFTFEMIPPSESGISEHPKFNSTEVSSLILKGLEEMRTEAESEVKILQIKIEDIQAEITNMYNIDFLKKVPFRLHAVLVHQGQASSGHYWAFVYNHHKHCYMKFNDETVTETTWSLLQKESVGGYLNMSAYCLIYVDKNNKQLFNDKNYDGHKYLKAYLSQDQFDFVNQYNSEFENELNQASDEHYET